MEVLGNTKEIPEDHGRARPTYYVKLKELQINYSYFRVANMYPSQ